MRAPSSERKVVALVATNSFVVLYNLTVVLVLGPDFTAKLGIPGSQLGLLNSAYAAGAVAVCVGGAAFFDRFDRRRLLAFMMFGLTAALVATSLARGLVSLCAARVVCGVFGIGVGTTSVAVLSDLVPVERRGRAMAVVSSTAAIVALVGNPAALEISRLFGWRTVFWTAGVVAAVDGWFVVVALPPLREHIAQRRDGGPIPLLRPAGAWMHATAPLVMFSMLLVAPNVATYVTHNLGYPRKGLSLVYFASGCASFATQRAMGPLTDRFGVTRVTIVNALFMSAVLALGFIFPVLSPWAVVIGFEMALDWRMVPYQTLLSKVPLPGERGRFNAVQSALHQAGSLTGALVGSRLLRTEPDHSLSGTPRLAAIAIAASALIPFLLWRVERLLARERAAAANLPATG